MKKQYCFILIMSVLLFTSSCNDLCDCFKPAGEIVTEERTLTPISVIEITNDPELVIHHDSIFRMRVSAGKNLIGKIMTDIDNGKLSISNKNRCNWSRKFKPFIRVDVWLPDLKLLNVYNSIGNVSMADTLRTDEFHLESFGSFGDINLLLNTRIASLKLNTGPASLKASGITQQMIVFNAGFGIHDCRNLMSNYVFIRSRGTNNAYTRCSGTLDASIESDGNIYYAGQPTEIIRHVSGSGLLIPLN